MTIMEKMDEIIKLNNELKDMLYPDQAEIEAIAKGDAVDAKEMEQMDIDEKVDHAREMLAEMNRGQDGYDEDAELDAVDIEEAKRLAEASEARTREEMRGEDLSDELRGK